MGAWVNRALARICVIRIGPGHRTGPGQNDPNRHSTRAGVARGGRGAAGALEGERAFGASERARM